MSSEQKPPDESSQIEELNLGPGVSPKTQEKGLKFEALYATLGLIAGMICVLGGIVLIVLGFTGSVEIDIASGAINGHLATGSLGIVVVIVGGVIIWRTRFNATIAGNGKNGS